MLLTAAADQQGLALIPYLDEQSYLGWKRFVFRWQNRSVGLIAGSLAYIARSAKAPLLTCCNKIASHNRASVDLFFALVRRSLEEINSKLPHNKLHESTSVSVKLVYTIIWRLWYWKRTFWSVRALLPWIRPSCSEDKKIRHLPPEPFFAALDFALISTCRYA
jgi:hypothetical protein